MPGLWMAVVGGVLLFLIPVFGWFAIPAANRRLGRPLEVDDPPPVSRFGAWYSWQLRGRAVAVLSLVLFMLWVVALLAVVQPLVGR